MTFKDWQLTLVTFQAWKMKFLNSMIFQVFHDQYKPCSETECSLLAEGSFPRYLAGRRKRDHTRKEASVPPCSHVGGGGGTLMLGNSGRGLDPRGMERCEGELPKWQDAKAKVQN